MKTIQLYIKYFACLVLLAAIVSCESVLDKKPLTEYSDATFFQEPAHANGALMGAYNRMQQAFNTEFIYYGEARADIDSLITVNTPQSISVTTNTLNFNLPFTDWGNMYQVIKQANLIIYNLKIMKEKGIYNAANIAEYNRVLGQAYGLRGFIYFYMTRIWGKLPITTEPILDASDINSFKTPRNELAEVYKQASNDLYTAEALLPTVTDTRANRITITKGAVQAILTDFYMWRNMPDSALIMSSRVIANTTAYKLTSLYNAELFVENATPTLVDNTDYAKMFINGFSTESIFEIDYNFLENTSSGLLTLYGGGQFSADFGASTKLKRKFFPSDPRRMANFIRNGFTVFKYFPKGTFDRLTDNDKNVILYRLADIILLRAEALVMRGTNPADRNAAWILLKQIRERAFGPVSAVIPTGLTTAPNDPVFGPTGSLEETKFKTASKDDAINILLDERAVELCFEGKRWYDLVRTGRVYTTTTYANGGVDRPLAINEENVLWPINITVIRRNPLIEQNSYYK